MSLSGRFSSAQSFLLLCRDVFLVGLADRTLRSQILRLCSVILLSGERWRGKKPSKKAGSRALSHLSASTGRGGAPVRPPSPAASEGGGLQPHAPGGEAASGEPGRALRPHPGCGGQPLPEGHRTPGPSPQKATRGREAGPESVFISCLMRGLRAAAAEPLRFFGLAPAVPGGRARADGLPPGRPAVGLGPPARGLLHPFCRHLSGEQTLASEGRKELRWPQIRLSSADGGCSSCR